MINSQLIDAIDKIKNDGDEAIAKAVFYMINSNALSDEERDELARDVVEPVVQDKDDFPNKIKAYSKYYQHQYENTQKKLRANLTLKRIARNYLRDVTKSKTMVFEAIYEAWLTILHHASHACLDSLQNDEGIDLLIDSLNEDHLGTAFNIFVDKLKAYVNALKFELDNDALIDFQNVYLYYHAAYVGALKEHETALLSEFKDKINALTSLDPKDLASLDVTLFGESEEEEEESL